MWKFIRITILLLILAMVLQQSFMARADLEWKKNFYVALYPVNADGTIAATEYIKTLTKDDFLAIEDFFAEEAERYVLGMRRPIAVQLGPEVKSIPPAPPSDGSVLSNMLWSLNFRWFAWNNSPKVLVKPEIRLYLLYYDPNSSGHLVHSTALDKGRIGRVNLFADKAYSNQNLVVVAHELLHTLSATDKYDLNSTLPIFPDGFANPEKQPLYPQDFAELMGGYLPVDETRAVTPKSLSQVLIGEKSAREIGWVK
ncbi:MAG TPA: hypothetical protein PLR90_09945 [Methylophilus sp.]|nr:hypothetical protein [Methylophilus sp.]HQQ34221.1 hypothetical protein [Methylophilus sp.]